MLLTSGEKEYLSYNHRGLVVLENKIEGIFRLKAGIDNKVSRNLIINGGGVMCIDRSFNIRIELFKDTFPRLYLFDKDLEMGADNHIYTDRSCCITHNFFEKKFQRKDFMFIFRQIIVPFLYNQASHKKFGEWIIGEYGHGIIGTLEVFFDESREGTLIDADYKYFFTEFESNTFIKNLKLGGINTINNLTTAENVFNFTGGYTEKSIKGLKLYLNILIS